MSAPRHVTPPASPVAPRTRTPASPVPWALKELQAPAQPPAPLRTRFGNGPNGGCSAAELTALREEMQEAQVKVASDARRAGFEEGRSAGRAEAERAADARLGQAIRAAADAAATIRQHEEHYVGVLEENLTALACAIARQVIQREVQLDPSSIRALVQDALAQFPQESTLKVRLNPADHSLLAGDAGYPDVTWMADPRVERGGCIVEGRERIVDGRVDIALDQIFRHISGIDA